MVVLFHALIRVLNLIDCSDDGVDPAAAHVLRLIHIMFMQGGQLSPCISGSTTSIGATASRTPPEALDYAALTSALIRSGSNLGYYR